MYQDSLATEWEQSLNLEQFARVVASLCKAHSTAASLPSAAVTRALNRNEIRRPPSCSLPGCGPSSHQDFAPSSPWIDSHDAHNGVSRIHDGYSIRAEEHASSSYVTSSEGGTSVHCAALDHVDETTRLVAEARDQITRFMTDHDILFDRADVLLSDIKQAWNVRTLSMTTAKENLKTLTMIACILKQYPTLRCTVHGESGAAATNIAPRKLAAYLSLDSAKDVRECMERLASFRAQACVEELVVQGVPRDSLRTSWLGEGAPSFYPFSVCTPGKCTCGLKSVYVCMTCVVMQAVGFESTSFPRAPLPTSCHCTRLP